MSRRCCAVFLTPLLVMTLALAVRGGATPPSALGATTLHATTGNTSTRGMVDHLDFGGFGGGSNPQVNYNPYSPNALTAGYTFESLYLFNNYSCRPVPWLATTYHWTDSRTL